MGIKENLENLYNDANEYVKRGIYSYKFLLIETISLLYGDVVCGFVLFMLLFLALIFLLVTMVAVLAPAIGFVTALLLAVALLVIIAFFVYRFRIRLFVDRAVKRFCRILFAEDDEEK